MHKRMILCHDVYINVKFYEQGDQKKVFSSRNTMQRNTALIDRYLFDDIWQPSLKKNPQLFWNTLYL